VLRIRRPIAAPRVRQWATAPPVGVLGIVECDVAELKGHLDRVGPELLNT